MNKHIKYQIFVSSTYEDLKDERDQVIKAILEMGHIPVGMEMFSAGDEEQWKMIQRSIDDCDYYTVIVAHRYGSLDKGISYTEKEYDYAVEKNIPVTGFIINERANWQAEYIDTDEEKVEKLKKFKSKVKSKMVSIWKNKEDLYGKVAVALMKQFNLIPAVGWIKSSEISDQDVTGELSRLSKENSELRNEISKLINNIKKDESEKVTNTIEVLNSNTIELSFFYNDSKDWEDKRDAKYYNIFKLIAPELVVEKSTKGVSHFLGLMGNLTKRKIRDEWPIPSNHTKEILSDFNILELVKPSEKKHSVKDQNEYWTLTEFGLEVLKEIRKEKLLSASLSEDNTKE